MLIDRLIRKIIRIFPAKIQNIYLKKPALWLYLIAGAIAMAISVITQYATSYMLGAPVTISTAVSWLCAASAAFALNKYEVFDNRTPGAAAQYIRFMSARLGVLTLEISFMYSTVVLFNKNELLMKLLAQIFIIILNYIFGKIVLGGSERPR